ncbi:hypothetical protein J2Z47_004675 [Cohnella thailandensis]|nr:hypothetical protein [Cohnella thailandensis]
MRSINDCLEENEAIRWVEIEANLEKESKPN